MKNKNTLPTLEVDDDVESRPRRTNIYVKDGVWKAFRMKCLEAGISASKVIETFALDWIEGRIGLVRPPSSPPFHQKY